MMQASVERIVRLTVDGTSAARQLERIAGAAAKTEGAFTKLNDGFRMLAGLVSVGALVQGFRNFTDTLDETGKAAERFGVTSEWLSGMGYAAELSGVQFDKLKDGLKDFAKNLGAAEAGSADMAKTLKGLGVTATGDVEQALGQLADRFAQMPDGPQKAQLAMKVFGEAGLQLIPMLNQGSAGIDELRAEAARLGVVLDSDATASAAAFNDNLTRMRRATEGISTQLVQGMLPAFTQVTNGFADVNTEAERWQKVGEGAGEIAKFIAKMFTGLSMVTQSVGMGLAAIMAAISTRSTEPVKAFLEDIERLNAEMAARMAKFDEEYTPPKPRGTTGPSNSVPATKDPSEKAKQLKESLASLNDMTRLGQSLTAEYSTEQERLYDKLGDLQAAYEAKEISETTYRRGIDETNQKLRELKPEYQAHLKMQEDARLLLDAIQSPQERYVKAIGALNVMLAKNAINSEQAARAVEMYKKLFLGEENPVEKSNELSDSLANLAGGTMRDIFRDTDSAGDAMARFTQRLAETAAEVLIITPLIQQLQAVLKGSSFLGFLGGSKAAEAAFNIPEAPRVTAFARGGVLTGPALFPLSGGLGLAGEAGFEAIMPLKRGPDGSLGVAGGGVTVNVINNAGARVTTQESQTPGGGQRIDVMVESVVSNGIQSGRFDSVMGASFGLRRSGR